MEHSRRLSDKIVAAHKKAWDDGTPDVEDILLQALELHVSKIGGTKNEMRDDMPEVEAAFALHKEMKSNKN